MPRWYPSVFTVSGTLRLLQYLLVATVLPYYTIYWCLQWYPTDLIRVLCGGHCRKQVALSALTCRSAPFALWDLAYFGGQRNQGTSHSNPHEFPMIQRAKTTGQCGERYLFTTIMWWLHWYPSAIRSFHDGSSGIHVSLEYLLAAPLDHKSISGLLWWSPSVI